MPRIASEDATGVVVAGATPGIYTGKRVNNGLQYLMKFLPNTGGRGSRTGHYFYGNYYAVQAMYTAGDPYWTKWYSGIRDELVKSQREDGSWHASVSREYATAMACIILQVPNDYLPILQK